MEEPLIDNELLMETGKKAFREEDYDLAQDLKLISVSNYGENSSESIQAHFHYGITLLQKAIQKSELLGGNEDNIEAIKVEEEPVVHKNNLFFEEDSVNQHEAENGEDEEVEEEEDDLQLAWIILEKLRCILMDKQEEKMELLLADVYLNLGKISMENETWDQSISDFENALNLKSKTLKEYHRDFSELNYLLGLSYEFKFEFEKSLEYFKKSVNVLELKLEYLGGSSEKDKKGKNSLKAGESVGEKEEIEELLIDLGLKLDDLKFKIKEKKEKEELLNNSNVKEEAEKDFLDIAKQKEDVKINDLNSFVKRKIKKKLEETLIEQSKTCEENSAIQGEDSSNSHKKRKIE
ncbi:hypothetical protein HK099_000582 [Clydaea vesicula]|uniref:Tetratricopeptide SHNi-TPR domain-containing protein n=1 Tax=Clydaea vesicula TaxID=447962 RepID=A0AAD5TUU6_9FUNG|nr:hypothetical protein HK099_000582 [Clydaea vesicula]